MINILGFSPFDALVGLLTATFMGLFMGHLLGLIRYVLFGFMEGHSRVFDMGKGGDINEIH